MQHSPTSLRAIYTEAAEIADSTARAAYLDSACQGDGALRTNVEKLLGVAASVGNFLGDAPESDRDNRAEKPGDRIGRYRLIEQLGRGGGGVVYLAEQEEPVRRRVALKVIKLGMDTQAVVARFEIERQALAMMDHPNIARVFDAGATDKGRPYFVMELVSGPRITDYCEERQLSIRQRLELFVAVCHAIQHAHQKGIIHRDLKPSNILVADHQGGAVPKVIDFGIAKAASQGSEGTLTRANQFIGTPAYMSPEQMGFGEGDIDTRADIYSLGVILYELLAGRPPFDPKELARGGFEEMRRVIRETEPPRPSTTMGWQRPQPDQGKPTTFQERATFHSDIDWIVMKCLEKERERRYETASELAVDIQRHLNDEPVLARPPSQIYRFQKIVRRHRLAFAATGMVVLILIAAVITSTHLALRATLAEREQSHLRSIAEQESLESQQRLIRRYVAEGNRLVEGQRPLAALPWLVEALNLETADAAREPNERLRIGQSLAGAPELLVHLTQGKSVNCVALSPDSRQMATGSDDGVVRVTETASGGDGFTNLNLGGNILNVKFSPDGSLVAGVNAEGQAQIWEVATGVPLTPLMRPDDFNRARLGFLAARLQPALEFSPDGKWVLLAWGSKSAQLREARTGKLVREFAHQDVVCHATISPNGQLVATSGTDVTKIWDITNGQLVGVPLAHNGTVAWSEFSADGNTLLTVRDRHVVQLWDWQTGQRKGPEIIGSTVLFGACLSPDGTKLLATTWANGAWLYDTTNGQPIHQFRHTSGLVDGKFSPDGRYIATACHDKNVWVWKVEDATGPVALLPIGEEMGRLVFSCDGRELAMCSRGGRARLWKLFPQESKQRMLPAQSVDWTEFDATGERALVVSGAETSEVNIFNAYTGELMSTARYTNRMSHAHFSPDGKRVLTYGNHPWVRVLESASGKESFSPIRSWPAVKEANWSPDGKFIVTRGTRVRLWEATTGKSIGTFATTNAVAMAFMPDATRLAIAFDNQKIRIWETDTRRAISDVWETANAIQELRFSPDGKKLAIATFALGIGGIVEVRNVESGAVIGQALQHRDVVHDLEFDRDSRWLATACEDHTARVWDVQTGMPITTWMQHDFECYQSRFSPDGQTLVTRDAMGTVRLWAAASGEPLTAPIFLAKQPRHVMVAFSKDGRQLLSPVHGGARIWNITPITAGVEELRWQAQALSCTRLDPVTGILPLDNDDLSNAWHQFRTLSVRR